MQSRSMRTLSYYSYLSIVLLSGSLGACGGGGSSSDPSISLQQRSDAATTTATSNSACTSITPFYWEIGNAGGILASGSNGSSPPASSTKMLIASASKWIFSTYVVEKQSGVLLPSDILALTFQSGYTNFSSCSTSSTVASCLTEAGSIGGTNGDHISVTDNKFLYNGGHMQVLANSIGLGADSNAALATDIKANIGTNLTLAYSQPQLAGGIFMDADNYAQFLRNMLGGTYSHMQSLLGSNAVCTHTNSTDCPSAIYSPMNQSAPGSGNDVSNEAPHYSLGHWVEDDPAMGDGAFSSAGAFGFYPWIDKTKSYYGILARFDATHASAGVASLYCGRKIRKAFITGTAQ
jgi:hypothetical protein